MKKLALLLFILAIATSTANTHPFAGGEGTENEPYQIETVEQLQAINEFETKIGEYFVLTADIDASETAGWNDGKGFKPINGSKVRSLDGNGHIVSGLVIKRPDEDRIGLFGTIFSGREIRRLGLKDVQISGNNYAGAIAGLNDAGNIYSVFATGTVTGNHSVGGLIGSHNSVMYAHYDGDPDYPTTLSGRIGLSYSDVNTTGTRYVGGLVGTHEAIALLKETTVFEASDDHIIQNSIPFYNTRSSEGDLWVISESYSTGIVSGDEYVGGIIGIGGYAITSSYWNTETSNQDTGSGIDEDAEGLTGLITDQMTGQDAWIHMYKLDFDQTWQLTEGYPMLAWQEPADTVSQPIVPLIVYGPPAHDFKGRGINTILSETREITIKNVGNTVLNADLLIAGPDADVYSIVGNTSSLQIDPDSIQIVEVAFSPDRVDNLHAVFQINHDAPNKASPVEVQLMGEGLDLNFAGGSGVEADPFQVATLEQLDEVRRMADAWFVQVADIDAGATKDWNNGKGFEPIGGENGRFSGNYNGDGHTISNLMIDRPGENEVGLFGFVYGGILENIILENLDIRAEFRVGGLAGTIIDGKILNSRVKGRIEGNANIGGLAGWNYISKICKGFADVEISSKLEEGSFSSIGGLVGANQGEVLYSYAGGNMTGAIRVGGLVGLNGSDIYGAGTIKKSFAQGNVSGDSRIGGLVGQHFEGTIENAIATGRVTGKSEVGGLIGIATASVGNAYAKGTVSGDSLTGGLIGNLSRIETPVVNSYWDTETTGQSRGAGSEVSDDIVGLSTAEMTRQENFVEWDFEEVWAIMEGESYPWLQKIGEPVLVTTEDTHIVVPKEFLLHQNHPNPFNPVTTIEYALPEQLDVRLEVFDVLGRRVTTLVDEVQQSGTYQFIWDASNVASGTYIYRLQAGDYVETRSMMFVK